MSRVRTVRDVAWWELVRYAKPKQQVIGFLFFVGILLGVSAFGRLGAEPEEIGVAVVGGEHLPALPREAGRFHFTGYVSGEQDRLRAEVEEGELDALLILVPGGEGELLVRRTPGWGDELRSYLTRSLSLQRLRDAGLDEEALARVEAPFRLQVRETAPRGGQTAVITALIALTMMLYGLFTGVGYIFASVTGEKQNKVSEQVVSAIPAQTWIDGKILGLSGVAVVNILNGLVAVGTWLVLRRLIWGDPIPRPPSLEDPGLVALSLVFIVLGFFFWFALTTAVAATVDDPQNSNRSILIFLPMVAAAPAFVAVGSPEAGWIWSLSLFPPTAFAVMPARLLMTPVPAWEVATAVLLLVAAIFLVRRSAGKIFRLAMLMYGKEPGWRELRRWLGEA